MKRFEGVVVPGMSREVHDGGLLQEIRKLRLGPKDVLVFKMDGGEWSEGINQKLSEWVRSRGVENAALAIGDGARVGVLVQAGKPEIDVVPAQAVRDLLHQLDMKPKDRDWSVIDKIKDLVIDDG